MAVDGRNLLSKSLYQVSDEDHGFPCSPCSKEGKNVAAIKYCVECDENMCKKCLNDHNKFAAMKGHQLLDKVKTPGGTTIELPSQRCENHGKLIDVYCPGHDAVGCSTCMNIEHRYEIYIYFRFRCYLTTVFALKSFISVDKALYTCQTTYIYLHVNLTYFGVTVLFLLVRCINYSVVILSLFVWVR